MAAAARVTGPVTFGANASGGLNKSGTGILVLSASNNSYAGPTNILAGTLRVQGTISGSGAISVASGAVLNMAGGNVTGAVTVNNGGTVGGFGLINNVVNVGLGAGVDLADGTFNTLNVTGNLNIDATTARGGIRFDYGAAGADRLVSNAINVTGTNSIVIYLSPLSITAPGQVFTLATYTGSNPNIVLDVNSSKFFFNTVSLVASGGSITATTNGAPIPLNAFWTGNFGTTWAGLDTLQLNDNFNTTQSGGLNTQ